MHEDEPTIIRPFKAPSLPEAYIKASQEKTPYDPELAMERVATDEALADEVFPRVEAKPGTMEELTGFIKEKIVELEVHLHRVALVARFVPTDFEIREAGIYARVRRDTDPGGWWVWRAIVFPTREQIIPDVIGLYEDRDEALQAAADTVDQLLKKMETDDTQSLTKLPKGDA